ncbi:hypothetical protein NEOKW01_1656 [Nematocida sp. AWRm80]|nr:hypothetical protein NEOKW01_1656 [Nematocida sp. AWRm80]
MKYLRRKFAMDLLGFKSVVIKRNKGCLGTTKEKFFYFRMEHPQETNWRLEVTEEHSYVYVLQRIYKDIKVEIGKDMDNLLTTPEKKKVKGVGKAINQFLSYQGVSEETQKRISEIVNLRAQQLIAYTPKGELTDIDTVIAISKIRKFLIEDQITNQSSKLSDDVINKLIKIHTQYQSGYCMLSKYPVIPEKDIKAIPEFYKVIIMSGCIDSIIDHPDADTLFIENVDFVKETRTIVSGLKGKFEKDHLVNQICLFTLNLKPVMFKGTESFGMILFAKDKETQKGTVVFAKTNGQRLQLKDYPLDSLVPRALTIGNCSKKTIDTFFSKISVSNGKLQYSDLDTVIATETIVVPGVNNGTIS